MGIATFETDSGAGFTWTSLAGAIADGNDLLVTTSLYGSAERTVTLATEGAFARRGYVARATFVPDPAAGTAELAIDASMHATRFALAPTSSRAGPLRLARLDDSQWLPMAHGPTGLSIAAGSPVTVLLGSGSYELCDPVEPARRQRFDVPAPGPIVIDPALSAARVDRP